VAERLDGLRGPMNVQIFCDGEDVNVIEINLRFGGGYPLAHHAGARFAQWLVDETIGGKSIRSEGWTEGLVMLRYDAEVIVEGLNGSVPMSAEPVMLRYDAEGPERLDADAG
jgi:carbamoyl-phosphate synthase large subunit